MKLSFTVLLTVAFVTVLPGCGKDESKTFTIKSPDGNAKITVDETGSKDNAGKMTMEGPDGKVTVQGDGTAVKYSVTDKDGKQTNVEMSGKLDTAAFEGMLYPGAQPEEGGGFSMKTGEGSTSSAGFWSADAPDKLVAHYKKLFPNATSMSVGTMTTFSGKNAAGADFSISIAAGEGTEKTKLTIMVIKKG